MTLTGDGFISSLTSVILDLSQYNALNGKITQITYTSLTLTTQSDQAGTFPLATYVNGVEAVCQIANCNFTFLDIIALFRIYFMTAFYDFIDSYSNLITFLSFS